jgi:hypothetical protein
LGDFGVLLEAPRRLLRRGDAYVNIIVLGEVGFVGS